MDDNAINGIINYCRPHLSDDQLADLRTTYEGIAARHAEESARNAEQPRPTVEELEGYRDRHEPGSDMRARIDAEIVRVDKGLSPDMDLVAGFRLRDRVAARLAEERERGQLDGLGPSPWGGRGARVDQLARDREALRWARTAVPSGPRLG